MARIAAFPTVPVSVLLLAGLILPVFAGANPHPQTEAAKTPEPGYTLVLGPVEAPGIDIRLYFTAVAAVLRHSWPSKIQANLITRGDKGILFVRAVILRSGSLQQGSPILEVPSPMAKLNDAWPLRLLGGMLCLISLTGHQVPWGIDSQLITCKDEAPQGNL